MKVFPLPDGEFDHEFENLPQRFPNKASRELSQECSRVFTPLAALALHLRVEPSPVDCSDR